MALKASEAPNFVALQTVCVIFKINPEKT